MPRSVLVLSSDPRLFDNVKLALADDQRFLLSEDNAHCDGSTSPVTNIYPVVLDSVEWDSWEPGSTMMPDPRDMSTLIFETQSETWVAEIGSLLAARLDAQLWFVDAADQAWPADQVDAASIALS